ncbi:MAG: DNA polymerase III subunit beta [Chlamydia sp. 32-24]|nr:MAG: DNA polymerase III subunit beta [Chlamydia sp. 32-24]
MKFVIATEELNYLINKCLNVVAQKSTLPILSNFLLEAKNGELILTATDLTVGVRCFTEAKIIEDGAVALPAKKFAQLVRELTAANIEITSHSNDIVEISANSSKFKIHGMNKNEFPSLPDVTDATQFKISQKALKELFNQTSFAVSREENRYVLTGLYLQIENGIATFIGTDGKRLAKAYAKIDINPQFKGSYIVPAKAVEEMAKNLEEESDATVFLMHDKIAVEASQTTIITKLLAGEYPDVSRVIPQNHEFVLQIHREELITLLRQISLFTADANHSVRFTFQNGELKLTANSIDIGEGKVSMPVNYHGQKLEIAFNPTYCLHILNHCKKDDVETITLAITDAYNPGIITPEENIKESPTPLYVLMPMRLNEE